jgi:hypothetical protein
MDTIRLERQQDVQEALSAGDVINEHQCPHAITVFTIFRIGVGVDENFIATADETPTTLLLARYPRSEFVTQICNGPSLAKFQYFTSPM